MPLLARVGNWYSFLFLLLSGWPGIRFTINFRGWPQLSRLRAMRNGEDMILFSKMDSHGLGKQKAKSRPCWRNPMEPKVWAHVARNYFVGRYQESISKRQKSTYRFSVQITVCRSDNLVSSRLRHYNTLHRCFSYSDNVGTTFGPLQVDCTNVSVVPLSRLRMHGHSYGASFIREPENIPAPPLPRHQPPPKITIIIFQN